MPLLLNVLSTRDADGPDFKNLRVKAMECAGLIGEIAFTLSVVISWLISISHRCWSECL
jgi:hypothetical protein